MSLESNQPWQGVVLDRRQRDETGGAGAWTASYPCGYREARQDGQLNWIVE